MEMEYPELKLANPDPTNVGYWSIGNNKYVRLMAPEKPKWLHRKMMQWLLGIKWNDMNN